MDDIPELVDTKKKISIIIITGFLGSGKTTFLNHILRENHGKRIVVIQNEFGDRIGLEEAMLLNKNDVMEWIEFPNGCLCCTVKTDMLMAIEKLVEKNSDIDSIFIETDGLADPEPIIRSLWVDSELESSIYLDATICIVDTMHFLEELDLANKHKNEAYRQVAYADIILMNKIDRSRDINELENVLTTINPIAKRYQTIKAQIPIRHILNTNIFNSINTILAPTRPVCNCHSLHNEGIHDPTIKAITIINYDDYTIEKVNKWLAYLLWEQTTMMIYRIKGLISVSGADEKYNLQAVMHTFDLEKSDILWKADETRINKIVVIGKNLDRELIENYKKDIIDSLT